MAAISGSGKASGGERSQVVLWQRALRAEAAPPPSWHRAARKVPPTARGAPSNFPGERDCGKTAEAVMALTAVCRRLSTVLRVTGASRGGAAAASASRGLVGDWPKKSTEVKICPCSALLHTSVSRNGLEEFFDYPKNWGKEVKSGDSWTVEQLRGKSSDDLHKLWYVLLKERNMLLTLEQEAKRQLQKMPSPERLEKVIKSMERMDQVIQEREDALRLLQTGQEKEWPGEWRYDFLGRIIWYTFREWPIPWYMNARHKRKRFYYLSNVKPFIRLRYEKLLRMKYKEDAVKKKREKRLQENTLAAESQS